MKLLLNYPALTQHHGTAIYERVRAELRAESDVTEHYDAHTAVAELRAHTFHIPLAPGDVVTYDVDTHEIKSIVSLAPVWTVHADFAIPANIITGQPLAPDDKATKLIEQTMAEWSREAWATKHGGLAAFVSAQDREWLEDRVLMCRYVDHMELVRYPGMEIDFEVCLQNADLGEETRGPWS